MRKGIAGAVVVAVLVVVLVFFMNDSNAGNQIEKKGNPQEGKEELKNSFPQSGSQAPDFTLEDLNGRKVKLSDLRGKPVLLNFWASWCRPCREETPGLVKVSEKYQGKVEFCGVNLTASDSLEDVKGFVSTYGVKYSILKDRDGSVAGLYMVQAIPTTFLIDDQGKILQKITGGVNEQTLESMLQQVVKH